MLKKITSFMQAHRMQFLALAAALVMLPLLTGAASAAPLAASTPCLDISNEISAAIQIIFDYGKMIIVALMGVVAIGTGFRFGGSILMWIGQMLGDAFHLRR